MNIESKKKFRGITTRTSKLYMRNRCIYVAKIARVTDIAISYTATVDTVSLIFCYMPSITSTVVSHGYNAPSLGFRVNSLCAYLTNNGHSLHFH